MEGEKHGLVSTAKTKPQRRRGNLSERGQQKVPEGRIVVDSDGVDKEAFESFKFKPGRPSLDPVAGAMRGEVRAEYKLENQRQNRKKQKITAIRQAAVASRKDRKSGDLEKLLGESSEEIQGISKIA